MNRVILLQFGGSVNEQFELVEGVHDEATSYLWYVRSPACSPSMHDKVSGASNYVNCVGSVRYHRSCSY
jgi:hypothetical protein